MSKIRNIVRICIMMGWTILCLLIACLQLIFSGFNSRKPALFAHRVFAPRFLKLAGAELEIKGIERVDFEKPYIFMSNHQSLCDIPILISLINGGAYFVAKHELRKIPIFGWYMAAVGMIFVKRGSGDEAIKSMKKAGKLIKNGKSVIIFPEGTRTYDGSIKEFKKGGFHLALEAEVPVVPISIKGANAVIPYSWLDGRPNVVKVRIGDPIDPKVYNKDSVEQYVNDTRELIKDLSAV